MEVRFKKLCIEARIPERVHANDVGMDVYSVSAEYDEEHDVYIYHTGLACETSSDIDYINVLFGYPRSSNCKTDCYLTNSVGIIDSDTYRGEIQARWKNRTSLETMIQIETQKRFSQELESCIEINHFGFVNKYPSYENIYNKVKEEYLTRARNLEFAPYKVGEKCFQLVVSYVPRVEIKEVDELSNTERGTKGFGEAG